MAALGLVLAARLAGAAERPWMEVSTPSFRLVTNGSEKDARQVVWRFEQYRRLVAGLIQAPVTSARPLLVLGAADAATFREIAPWYGPDSPVVGAFARGDDTDTILLRMDREMEHVVLHEYVHLLSRLSFRWLPLWLNEGLAEFYATAEIGDREIRFGRLGPNAVHFLRLRGAVPVRELLTADSGSKLYARDVSTFYAESAALVHLLLLGEKGERRPQLAAYLRRLGAGEPPARAAEAFGDLGDLDGSLHRYVSRLVFPALTAPAASGLPEPSVRSLSADEAAAIRAEHLARFGRWADARNLADGAAQRHPSLTAAHRALARVAAAQGRDADAVSEADKAIAADPGDGLSHHLAASVPYRKSSDEAEAVRRVAAARRATELLPGFAPGQATLASLLERAGQPAAAEAAARRATAMEPGSPHYWLLLAEALAALDRKAEARAIEEDVARAAVAEPLAMASILDHYRRADRSEEAERLLRRSFELSPSNQGTVVQLADVLADAGKLAEAEATLRRGLAAAPDDPHARNALAYFLADHGGDLAEARRLVEGALKDLPESRSILDTLGWVQFREHRLEEAEATLRKALGDDPDAVALDHLADVLAARGKSEEARQLWERAVDRPWLKDSLREKIKGKLTPVPSPAA
jgi:tetratricopeptide (TPR) repeat protein